MSSEEPDKSDKMDLDETIIKYSVGIGKSFEEAAEALEEAKSKDKDSLANIVEHEGPKLEDKDVALSSNADNYIKILRFLQENDADDETIHAHSELGEDPRTGLFNKMGYETARLELKELGVSEGYFILLDGNNMHDHNAEKGYTSVDEYLEATGRAIKSIVKSTRSGLDRRGEERACLGRRKEPGEEDIIGHRVNDSAGDEFLIYVPLKHNAENKEIVGRIAERVIENIYDKEREVAKGQSNPQD